MQIIAVEMLKHDFEWTIWRIFDSSRQAGEVICTLMEVSVVQIILLLEYRLCPRQQK